MIIWNGTDLVMLAILAVSGVALLMIAAFDLARAKLAARKRKGKR